MQSVRGYVYCSVRGRDEGEFGLGGDNKTNFLGVFREEEDL